MHSRAGEVPALFVQGLLRYQPSVLPDLVPAVPLLDQLRLPVIERKPAPPLSKEKGCE
jgi:hypothetical protein